VWNEPNLDFWGRRSEGTDLLPALRRGRAELKLVSPAAESGRTGDGTGCLGGSLHSARSQDKRACGFRVHDVYGNDLASDVFGTQEQIPRSQMVAVPFEKFTIKSTALFVQYCP